MQSGKLRHLSTIQQPSSAVDVAGQANPTWSTWRADVWCRIKQLSGGMDEERGRSAAQARFEIQYRHMSGLDPSKRIQAAWNGATITINIESVNPDITDKRFMIVTGTQEING